MSQIDSIAHGSRMRAGGDAGWDICWLKADEVLQT